ncbi:MAG TPA: DegT/DnrJ/EryC1/StrS family aminotransferase [Verrucomicrobiae bacterium]|nr:DegT/DnrJ/EryC1/StrS family aminotransferase [Verrucomicrobiae bacterium]
MDRKIDFWVPQFGSEEKARVADVIDSGFLNDGDVTSRFEREVASLLGCKHVVATTSGTSAIFLALAGTGVHTGDEVLVPDVTFIATANAVSLAGAKPVLVDVDPHNLNLDPAAAERAITPRTRAIVPVHVSGRAADISAISELAKRHGLLVIEDAAEAFLSKHRGRCLGTFGNAGCFSLSPNKTISTGQGGLIATDDDQLHVRLRELKDQGRPARGTGGDDTHNSVGYNFKFTNLQAAIGLAQLMDLSRRADRMRSIYKGYRDGLRGVDGVSVFPFDVEQGELPQWTDVLVDQRDALYDHLASKGMRGRRFWHPLHTQVAYRSPSQQFPNSSKQIPHAMWLPSAFVLSDEDVATVCGEIRNFVLQQAGLSGGHRPKHAVS